VFQNSGVPDDKAGMVPSGSERVESTWLNSSAMVFQYYLMGLAYQCQDIVFRSIIEYSNLRDLKVLTLKVILFLEKI